MQHARGPRRRKDAYKPTAGSPGLKFTKKHGLQRATVAKPTAVNKQHPKRSEDTFMSGQTLDRLSLGDAQGLRAALSTTGAAVVKLNSNKVRLLQSAFLSPAFPPAVIKEAKSVN